MFINSAEVKVYLVLGATDMRKAINGLSVLVEQLDLDPFSGHLFGKRGDVVDKLQKRQDA